MKSAFVLGGAVVGLALSSLGIAKDRPENLFFEGRALTAPTDRDQNAHPLRVTLREETVRTQPKIKETRITIMGENGSNWHEFFVYSVNQSPLCAVQFKGKNKHGEQLELTYTRREGAGRGPGSRRHHQLAGKMVTPADKWGQGGETTFFRGRVMLDANTRLPDCAYTDWPDDRD